MDIDPAKGAQAPRAETNQDAEQPRMLCLGVLVWSDDPEIEPTVLAHDSPVVVAHATALEIHEMLEDSPAYVGAAEFLETRRGPRDWRTPEDVDAWLEALREATRTRRTRSTRSPSAAATRRETPPLPPSITRCRSVNARSPRMLPPAGPVLRCRAQASRDDCHEDRAGREGDDSTQICDSSAHLRWGSFPLHPSCG